MEHWNTPKGRRRRLPDTKVGTFTQALYDEATKDGWIVVSMKNDWKRSLPVRDVNSRRLSQGAIVQVFPAVATGLSTGNARSRSDS